MGNSQVDVDRVVNEVGDVDNEGYGYGYNYGYNYDGSSLLGPQHVHHKDNVDKEMDPVLR